jgi:hypothetical protein
MRRTRAIASSLARMAKNSGYKKKVLPANASFFSTAANENRTASHTDVAVTQHTSTSINETDFTRNAAYSIHSNNEAMKLVDSLLLRTSEMMDPRAANVVAYSGGVDSSLVAALVHRVFADYDNILSHNNGGSVQAVLGISHAVPQTQIDVARSVADFIGIQLIEVSTEEGSDEAYIRNDGHACFVCKTHLYSTLNAVANAFMEQHIGRDGQNDIEQKVILYNGTNADDTRDPTRLGLRAASNFSVQSPLDQISKYQVRQAAK